MSTARGDVWAVMRLAPVVAATAMTFYARSEVDRLDNENRRLEAQVAKLESELPPSHMWIAYTGSDGNTLGIEPGWWRRSDGKEIRMYPVHVLELWLDDYRRREDRGPRLFPI